MSVASVASVASRPSRLVCPSHLLPIVIEPQSTILIRGPSGHGKSTFVKGITGALRGVCIDYEEAGTFRNAFVLVGQGIKHKLDFESLTLRELFEHSTLDEIQQLLSTCLLESWRRSLESESTYLDWTHAPIHVSGGERNRLTLAYHLYLAVRRQCPVIILDECEQGTDLWDPIHRNDAYKLVENIRVALPEKTLIVVSHFYNSTGAPLLPGASSIAWTRVLSLEHMNVGIQ